MDRAFANRSLQRSHSCVADQRGAVFLEFLIVFLPVLTFFLCIVQLGLLYSYRLVTEHAAMNAARSAAVVVGDDKRKYGNEAPHQVRAGGARYATIRRAALLSLAPLIQDGTVQSLSVVFPPPDQPGGNQARSIRYNPMQQSTVQKVRVRVEIEASCRIGLANLIACGSWLDRLLGRNSNPLQRYPTRRIKAEAIFPYQGASYDYK